MTDFVEDPTGVTKVDAPPATSVYASAASTAPQMSMGRWVKDSDLEAQTKEHKKVRPRLPVSSTFCHSQTLHLLKAIAESETPESNTFMSQILPPRLPIALILSDK